jgi:Dolichyl-phosphate-mannose-protein mannosyltransferase
MSQSTTETMPLMSSIPVSQAVPRRRSTRELVAAWANYSSWDLAACGLLLLVAVLIVLTFTQYGTTWDEPVQNGYGAEIVRYYVNLLHGHYALPVDNSPDHNLYLYGGLFDTLAAPFNIWHHKLYECRHLFNALFGLIGLIGCWKVGRFIGGPAVGFLSTLLLVITPRYYGAMFNNPKDIPFAIGYIWSIYYILQFSKQLPDVSPRVNLRLGLAIGATLATRVGGLILFGYLGLAVAIWFVTFAKSAGFSIRTVRVSFPVLRSCAWITALSWAIMLMFWPWAQARPFTRPFQALTRFSHFADWQGNVLYGGTLIKATELPRGYILRWLAITLPEIFLAALLVGFAYSVWKLFSRSPATSSTLRKENLRNAGIVLLASIFPIVYVIARRSVLYNAERHLTFVLPPLACLAAWGCYLAVSEFGNSWRHLVVASALVYLAFHLTTMVRLHPDEYVYFNQLVGGLKGAYGRYDTDYWGNSYREAVRDLSEYLGTANGAGRDQKYKIYLTYINRSCVTYYFPRNFSLTYDLDQADYFIANTSIGMDKLVDGPVVLKVERLGVPLAVVKELPAAKNHRLSDVVSKLSKSDLTQLSNESALRHVAEYHR